jgi:tetratricopeptide (TPR) repeat protein
MQDDRDAQSKWVKWLEKTAVGRLILGAIDRLDDIIYLHRVRFAALDERAYQIRFMVAVAFLLILFIPAGGWFGWTAYHHIAEKHDQAQAEAFLANHDYRSAVLSARQTLAINPANLSACRIMAQIADLSSSPSAVAWQQRVVAVQPSVENKLQLAAVGLRYQKPPFPLTTQILQELAPAATNVAGYQMLAAHLALSTHQLTEVEGHFEKALALEPTNQFYALNLAAFRLAMTNQANKIAARQVLDQLRTDPKLGPAALRALVVDRWENQDLAGANAYSTELLATPQATIADQLQNLKILQLMKPDRFDSRLGELQDQTATNSAVIGEVSAWMQANGLLSENIEWLTNLPDDMQSQVPVQLALAQAYLQNKDWPSLRVLVAQGNWGDLEYLRFALVSHASAKLGMMDLAALNWGAAVNEGGDRLDVYTKLLELAETWDMKNEQVPLLERIVQQFPGELWARQRLAQHYYATGNTVAMHDLFAHLNTYFPENVDYQNNLAATALILKTNLHQAFKLAEEAYTNAPSNPYEASTFAYSLHLQHRDREGLEIFKKLTDAQLKLPSVALYYGLLLVATGSLDEAKPYLEIARAQGGLWPEEQLLLNGAWQKINGRKR